MQKPPQRKDRKRAAGRVKICETRPHAAAKRPVTIEVSSSPAAEMGEEDNGDVSEAVIGRKHKVTGPPSGTQ